MITGNPTEIQTGHLWNKSLHQDTALISIKNEIHYNTIQYVKLSLC
jgi:hypothetical protein